MAGKPGDIPQKGSDNSEDLNLHEASHDATESLRQAAFKPNEIVQRLENGGERYDPRVVETSMAAINSFMKKYLEPDPKTGLSQLDLIAQHLPDRHPELKSSIYELKDKSQQTAADIQQFLKRLST